MAINKLVAINNGSTPASGDWARLVEYQNAFMRQVNSGQIITDGTYLKQGSYIQHGGVLYRVDDEDYTILGSTQSGIFSYIIIEASGDNLTATWATDISSYNWNYIYSELLATDESGVLPYVVKDGIVYKLEQKDIMYKSNQNLKTTDDVEFNSVDVDNGLTVGGNLTVLNILKSYTVSGGTTKNIDNLGIGQMAIVYANMIDDGNSNYLYTPAETGKYFVLTPTYWDDDIEINVYDENTQILQNRNGVSDYSIYFLILRIV
jgi:hypothetical protein